MDYNKIKLNDNSFYFDTTGMYIELGGIAKGYAIDEAVKVLRELNVKSALVNAGGDLYALGKGINDKFWRIGIRHPRYNEGESEKEIFGILSVCDEAIATSGDYEQFFIEEENGKNGRNGRNGRKRYHHILNPDNGYPAMNGCVSVTILTDNCMKADAFATAIFVMGIDDGKEFILSRDDLEGIIIYEKYEKDDKINYWISPNIEKRFQFIE